MSRFFASVFVGLVALLSGAIAFAATGGPDAGGYRFIDNAEQNGPVFAYEDISGTGTAVTFLDSANDPDEDDGAESGIAIGFPFSFYGNTYTETTISTNGNLQFGTEIDTIPSGPVPIDGNNPPWERTISVFGDDLDGSECGDVYFQSLGVEPNRRFIVQWDTCTDTPPNGALACAGSVQVILFEGTNHILMQYNDTTFSEPSPDACDGNNPNSHDNGADNVAVGIQSSEESGLNYPVSETNPNIIAGLAICFYPDATGTLTEGFCGSTNDADTVCDFIIDKTNDLPEPTAVNIGDTFTWTLTVTWDNDCDDVVYDITDDLPDGFDVTAVSVVSNDGDDFTCSNADPVICDDAMTFADPGSAVVEVDVEVTEGACGEIDNEAVVTPVTTDEAPATGGSDIESLTMAVDCPGDGSITIVKSCPFGGGASEFTMSIEDAAGDVVDADEVGCGGTTGIEGLAPGNYTLTEVLSPADAAAFATAIACADDIVAGASTEVTLEAGEDVECVVINALGVSPLILDLLINNTNTNEIDVDNTNSNNNANDNANENFNANQNSNENENQNTNEQDQSNDQTQDNTNDQTNNIDSSPEVNIDFD